MIRIEPKNIDKSAFRIALSARRGFKRHIKAVKELDLIYGHSCPVCGNVIQAMFRTPQPINLWPYEETVVLSQGEKNAGDIRKVLPDEDSKLGDSCYRSVFNTLDGGYQKIILKNHILTHEGLAAKSKTLDGSSLWEVGPRACLKTGIFSLREDLLVKDILAFSGMSGYDILGYKIPNLKACLSEEGLPDWQKNADLLRLSNTFGTELPVVLIDRDKVIDSYWRELSPRINKYHNLPK